MFRKSALLFVAALVFTCFAAAHPGSGIVFDKQGNLYFTDTGFGVWKFSPDGKLTKFHDNAFHWLAIDLEGGFSQSLTRLTDDSFIRLTASGGAPTLVSSGGYPIAIHAGRMYYAPFKEHGPMEIVAKDPGGRNSVAVTIPADVLGKPIKWVNGIVGRPGDAFYFSENTAVRRVGPKGEVSTVASNMRVPCINPLPDTPGSPHLRGLDIDGDGTLYVAANGCRSVIKIAPSGDVRTILTAEAPWSPTGVAVFRGEVFVLEYDFSPVPGREWPPRVRKVAKDGTISTLVTIPRIRPR